MSQVVQCDGRDAALADEGQPAADGDIESQRCTLDLPLELMHAVLLALGHDIVALSAMAGVNKSWRAAALHPKFWAHLPLTVKFGDPRPYPRFGNLTDDDLAVLVRRACGTDGGYEHKLVVLEVGRRAPYLTLRGVLAALGGPRDDVGTPLLRGALEELSVAGVLADDIDDDARALFRELRSYVRPRKPGNVYPGGPYQPMDVNRIAQCSGTCQRLIGRYASGCDDCGIALCSDCIFRRAIEPCNHICGGCYDPADEEELDTCALCGDTRRYCNGCSSFCDNCFENVCKSCAEQTQYVACAASYDCFSADEFRGTATFCNHCAFELEHVKMCADCTKCYCCSCEKGHCGYCAEVNLVQAVNTKCSRDDHSPSDNIDPLRLLCPDCRCSGAANA